MLTHPGMSVDNVHYVFPSIQRASHHPAPRILYSNKLSSYRAVGGYPPPRVYAVFQ